MADQVRNAADPRQVKGAGRRQREREEQLRASVAAVMSLEAGRLVMWELLERAGVSGRSGLPTARSTTRPADRTTGMS